MRTSNIGGRTIHSWAGIGKGEDAVTKLIAIALKAKGIFRTWKSTHTLMIDESASRSILGLLILFSFHDRWKAV
jgi:hypothetical protein